MPIESATHISDLVATNPVGGTDTKATLDDHIRLMKTVLLTDLPGITGPVTATHTELNYVDGVTSAIQTQLDAKAPTASPTFTGTPAAPTAAVGTSTTQLATTAFVANTAFSSVLPAQTGNSGKVVTTDGTNASWASADSLLTAASQAEMETGTEAAIRAVSPLRVAQAIAALSPLASQAEQEAATSTTKAVTPGRQQFHPSAAKAWIKCNAAGSISASYNVTSITDAGTGQVNVNIATDFSSANYAISATAEGTFIAYIMDSTSGAGVFAIRCMDAAGVLQDPFFFHAVCFGDQA